MRSAIEPLRIATVIMAKVIWKITKRLSGIVPLNASNATPFSIALDKSPKNAPVPENAIEYPAITHTKLTKIAAERLNIIVLSTFFLRTIPP
ncbi:hypothetical protein D9M71_438020 [compost metagenome]